jgi:hypothetical protein
MACSLAPTLLTTPSAMSTSVICPNGRPLRTSGTVHDGRVRKYLSQPGDCRACELKARCTRAPFRKIARDINEEARDHARSLKDTLSLSNRAMSAREWRCVLPSCARAQPRTPPPARRNEHGSPDVGQHAGRKHLSQSRIRRQAARSSLARSAMACVSYTDVHRRLPAFLSPVLAQNLHRAERGW